MYQQNSRTILCYADMQKRENQVVRSEAVVSYVYAAKSFEARTEPLEPQ